MSLVPQLSVAPTQQAAHTHRVLLSGVSRESSLCLSERGRLGLVHLGRALALYCMRSVLACSAARARGRFQCTSVLVLIRCF